MCADARRPAPGVSPWLRAASVVLEAFLLLAVVPSALFGQIPIEHYTQAAWTRKDGLSGSQVWTLAQDRVGYIWLGTNEGLVRFDSAQFVKSADLGLSTLPTRSVRTLLVARDGTLWIGFGADGGISNVKDGRVRNYAVADGLPLDAVAALLEDRDGVIWAATLDGLFRLGLEHWESVNESNGFPLKTVAGLFEDSEGTLWVGTARGVYRRGRHEERLTRFSQRPNLRSFSADRFGTIWATGLGTTITAINPRNADHRHGELVHGANGSRLVHDSDGSLWVATLGDGLLHINDAGTRVIKQYNGKPALTSDVIQCLLQDREGNIWVGTQNGLNRFSEASVVAVPEPNDGMSRLVHAVTADADGAIWVAAGNGLYQFSGASRRRYDWRSGLPRDSIPTALHSDADGHLWVASSTSVGQFSAGRFRPVAVAADVHFSRLRSIAVDSRRDLWTCDLDRGVLRLHDGHRVPIKDDPTPKGCSTLYADSSGRVWVGMLDGTLKVYKKDDVTSFSEGDGLLGGMIVSIHEDSHHQIWIGSPHGLSVFREGRFAGIGASGGLPGNIVVAVSSDRFGGLWLGVSSGIVRIDESEVEQALKSAGHRVKFRLFESADGLRGDPIGLGDPTVARAPDGTLWFATSDGLALIDPRRRVRAPVPPLVNIEQIIADDRHMTPHTISLEPRTRRVQIDFTALSFTAPEKTRFQYRLIGYDQNWVEGGSAREAVYTNLRPGEYTFLVRAVNQGVISERPATWQFSVGASFVQTAWFPASLLAVVVVLIAGGWRVHVHQVNAKFSAVLIERARVARELHDTLLQSLSSIALQLDDIAALVPTSPRVAEPRLHELRKRVEFWVREARQSITDLRSSALEMRDLGTALKNAGHRLTAGMPIHFVFNLHGAPWPADVRTEENLFRIGQEAIRNSIRHGHSSRIAVDLTYLSDSLSLRVSDDGIGFDPATISGANHWGLTTMEERAEQIGGVFQLTSQTGHGTVIQILVEVRSRERDRHVRRAS